MSHPVSDTLVTGLPLIADTESTHFPQSKDGSLKKTVLKGTVANITILPKRKADDEITGSGKLKRAKAVGDILEHFSEHSLQTKAELVSKIIEMNQLFSHRPILSQSVAHR